MKSIRSRILVTMLLTVIISLVLVGATSTWLNYNSAQKLLEQTISETAEITAAMVSKELLAYTNIAIETGSLTRLTDPNSTTADKNSIVEQRAATHGFERGNIIMPNGISIFDGNDYSQREYFIESMAGRTCVSEPLLSKRTNQIAMIISAPLWENGIPNSKVAGVVYFAPPPSFLNDIVTKINISPNSSAYIIDKEGYTIAHKDVGRVEQRENIEELAKTDTSLHTLSAINAQMRAGQKGFEAYRFNGENKFSAFAPIEGSDSWSIALVAPTSDFMSGTINSTILTAVLLLFAIVISTIVAFFTANLISAPIRACTARLQLLEMGDLKSPVPHINTKDETGTLAYATQSIITTLNAIISDEDYLLSQMSQGNFNVRTNIEEKYIGDFRPIFLSMQKINLELTDTLLQINNASDQVSSGSAQIASGAQALASGATEQASSIEELSASILEIADQVNSNAELSKIANEQANVVGVELTKSNAKMKELITAMEEMNTSSEKIGKVIKTIEDIAFQTNILALNAAIEAARAGTAGKGFAVVAEEVRNLSSKSAEAAKSTTELIEHSVNSVLLGAALVDDTAKALLYVVDRAKESAQSIDSISISSSEQALALAQITIGVDQISSVVQTNSATAQESAAASEELSSQSQMLKELVDHFSLRTTSE